jgi:hypothetical protein
MTALKETVVFCVWALVLWALDTTAPVEGSSMLQQLAEQWCMGGSDGCDGSDVLEKTKTKYVEEKKEAPAPPTPMAPSTSKSTKHEKPASKRSKTMDWLSDFELM